MKSYFHNNQLSVYHSDAISALCNLPADSIDCCVTSPPYWGLRDYGVAGQMGLEKTPAEYVAQIVAVFNEVRRVLKPSGTCWVNLGDSYVGAMSQHKNSGSFGETSCISKKTQSGIPMAGRVERGQELRAMGLKPKDLVGIPWRVAFALQDSGWWLRQDIIWHKPNPMPESVRDRCTKAHEYVFLLTKSERYTYAADAIKEPCTADHEAGNNTHRGAYEYEKGDQRHRTKAGLVAFAQKPQAETRNKRSVWTITSQPTPEAHFATFPLELPETCILAGCPEGGTVLDPFNGAGTTGLAALKHGRNYIGIEINQEYIEITMNRLQKHNPLFGGTE